MRKIKGIRNTKANYIHKIISKDEKEEPKEEISSFALVVVRKLPWYKKLVKKIRNFIVIYRWRKAR